MMPNNKLSKILAWFMLVFIIGFIIATLIAGILGSPLFKGFLVSSIILPIACYIFFWLMRVFGNGNQNQKK